MNPPVASSSNRRIDFTIAAALVALALAISPIGIRFFSGRLDLSPRVIVLSLTFDAFLLALVATALACGRLRRALFYLLLLGIPLVLLAAVEAGAVAVRLADRIAPLEDLSTLANRNGWPAHFMSVGRRIERDGLPLYRPWKGGGIAINELGLRTAPPTPKASGEWRIAVTGASVAFGWRVADADTIPVLLQQILRGKGFANVTVYNFAVDSIMVADELALLERFREVYAIDQVVFLTGANDVMRQYMDVALPPDRLAGLITGINGFELLKVAGRLKAALVGASPELLAKLDALLPKLAQRNSLRDGLIAADAYCRAAALRCDFVLQPVVLRRKTPSGPEIALARTLRQVYPRYEEAFATVYRTVLGLGLPAHDASDVFDRSAEPYFIDVAHLNEAGNRQAAERIARIAAARLPRSAERSAARP